MTKHAKSNQIDSGLNSINKRIEELKRLIAETQDTIYEWEEAARENDICTDTSSLEKDLERYKEELELQEYRAKQLSRKQAGANAENETSSAEIENYVRLGDQAKTMKEALKYYLLGAEGGNAEAMYKFARVDVWIHHKQSQLDDDMIWRAAELGYVPAQVDAGSDISGYSSNEHQKKQMEFLLAAASHGSAEAYKWLVHHYEYGQGDVVPKNPKLADEYRLKLYNSEWDEDAFAGCLWLNKKSYGYDFKASERRENLIWMLECYEKGNPNLGIVPNQTKALELCEQLGGDYYIKLADAYLSGKGVEQSNEKAIEYLKKATDGATQGRCLMLAERFKELGLMQEYKSALKQALHLMEEEYHKLENDTAAAAIAAYGEPYHCDSEKMFTDKRDKIQKVKALLSANG